MTVTAHYHRAPLKFRSRGGPRRDILLQNFICLLRARCFQCRTDTDLDDLIEYLKERLLFSRPYQTEHPLPSGNLTTRVRDRINQRLSLSFPGTIAEREVMTGNLVFYLNGPFDRKQDVGDLNFGTTFLREAIQEPQMRSDAPYYVLLKNLSLFVRYRFRSGGDHAELDETIRYSTFALVQLLTDNPDRIRALKDFGATLMLRSEQRGTSDDLGQAIAHLNDALQHCTTQSPLHAVLLEDLCAILSRYRNKGDPADLDKAIALIRQGSHQRGSDKVNASLSNTNHVAAPRIRFEVGGGPAEWARQLVARCPLAQQVIHA
ncbi:hypothetical protein EDD16DRAFT_696685 [Pisolithus croceorrhizus]|nr:hypothetical protein EDD16DRAFT_696685 [Pisolithus croceorrhizus]KAI6112348.1 hypothetical protein EV401DRAFT_200315 [Pisolithus croceorrhizus]KAI6160729.1 hypothetical protein EDD17DRAFT_761006 [Pisolithus thermaeus]